MQPKIISADIYPITFIFCSMIAATVLILVGIKIPNLPDSSLTDIGITSLVAILAIGLGALGFRKRTVVFDEQTKQLSIQWGKRWPVTYRRFSPTAWQKFEIQLEHPVGVTPTGRGTVRTTNLPPQWRLWGYTPSGRKTNLGRIRTESAAKQWQTTLNSSLSL